MGLNEVLNNLKGWVAWDFKAYHIEKGEADIVIKALEKQKPQKLTDAKIGAFTVSGDCPTCGRPLISTKDDAPEGCKTTNYCRYCGQKITWEGKAADNEN